MEADIEEDIDMKRQFSSKKWRDLFSLRDACSRSYVDSFFKNDIDFNDVRLKKSSLK